MALAIAIEKPALLPDLLQRLKANGCVTRAVDDCVCHVVHPAALDEAEELCEVRFFVRAWQARNGGVEITLESISTTEF